MKKKYNKQDICKIVFEDESNNDCGNLASYYLAFKGETWYEKNFNAKLQDNELMKDYIKYKSIFNTKVLSNDDFKNFLINNKNINDNDISILIDLYKESNSNIEFFKKLYKYIKNNNVNCITFLRPWLDSFIKDRLKFAFINNKKWIIEINVNESLPKFKKEYMNIKKREYYLQQIYSGKLYLKNNEKEKFKNKNWIGWSNIIDTNDYNDEDRDYLNDLLKKFELN